MALNTIMNKTNLIRYGFGIVALLAITAAACFLLAASQRQHDAQVYKQQITQLQSELNDVVRKSPATLNGCLDTAAMNYSNAIKAKGSPSANPDQPGYYMSMDEWKKLDNHLAQERADCHAIYGN